jgi:hypothetical protein
MQSPFLFPINITLRPEAHLGIAEDDWNITASTKQSCPFLDQIKSAGPPGTGIGHHPYAGRSGENDPEQAHIVNFSEACFAGKKRAKRPKNVS